MNDMTPLKVAGRARAVPGRRLAQSHLPVHAELVHRHHGHRGSGARAEPIPDSPLPDLHQNLHEAGRALWMVNIGLFTLFSLLYAARWVFFFSGAQRVFEHGVASMFFGAIPMGLATIINGLLAFGIPLWGDAAAVAIAHPLWWVDVALSLASGLLVPFLMFTRQDHSMENMTAVWLIPIVAAEVAAASGGMLIPHLAAAEAFGVLIASYVLWAFSVPLAMSVLVILLLRLILHKLPDRNMAASGWLALGPIGTGSLGLLLLGGDAPATFAAAGIPGVGDVAFGIGVIGGTVLWGYGVWWLLLAVLKMAQLCPPRHALQPRLVGLHLPARRLYAGDAGAGARHASRILLHRGQRPGRQPRGLLAGRRHQNAAWGVVRLSVRGPLPYRAAAASLRLADLEAASG